MIQFKNTFMRSVFNAKTCKSDIQKCSSIEYDHYCINHRTFSITARCVETWVKSALWVFIVS